MVVRFNFIAIKLLILIYWFEKYKKIHLIMKFIISISRMKSQKSDSSINSNFITILIIFLLILPDRISSNFPQ